jgi:hypothetical protein
MKDFIQAEISHLNSCPRLAWNLVADTLPVSPLCKDFSPNANAFSPAQLFPWKYANSQIELNIVMAS